ncbi:MAG: hypothetical protein U0939_01970 [Pirellulales bacterium]
MVWLQRDAQGNVASVDRPLPRPGPATVPGDWRSVAGDDFRGVVRFVRRFGRPTGLDPADRVVLVVEQIGGRASVWLQGDKLADAPASQHPFRCDLTERLAAANELWIDLEWLGGGASEDVAPPFECGYVGEVRLEICDP